MFNKCNGSVGPLKITGKLQLHRLIDSMQLAIILLGEFRISSIHVHGEFGTNIQRA